MADRDVIVIGDIVCDVWRFVAHGTRNPENAALVLTSDPRNETIMPGGAGLTALCLQKLGARVKLFGVVDDSPEAKKVESVLMASGVEFCHVPRISTWHTPKKHRYLNSAGNILVRHDVEIPARRSLQHVFLNLEFYENALDTAACVVISDYGKGYLDDKRYKLVELACRKNVPVFVDCKEQFIPEYAGATVFKINHPTASLFTCRFGDTNKNPCDVLHRHTSPALSVVTCGDSGVSWRAGKTSQHAGHEMFPVLWPAGNAVGAGDAFMAGMVVWFLMAKTTRDMTPDNIRDALLVGHLVANKKITTTTVELSPSFVLSTFCKQKIKNDSRFKIMNNELFAAYSRACLNTNQRVVFTNGCFDVLHAGHMHLLREAKKRGDVLIVALDSNKNVQRLKGFDRPVQDAQTRADILAAMDFVDAVTVFDDTEHNAVLEALIKRCKPSVLVKGGDYTPEECVGWKEVTQRKNPGEVVCCSLLAGFSTTKILEKVRGKNV